jgi:hypothetical protein
VLGGGRREKINLTCWFIAMRVKNEMNFHPLPLLSFFFTLMCAFARCFYLHEILQKAKKKNLDDRLGNFDCSHSIMHSYKCHNDKVERLLIGFTNDLFSCVHRKTTRTDKPRAGYFRGSSGKMFYAGSFS